MEALPNELKLNILRQADFQGLKALIHASSIYHAVYQSCRLDILNSAAFRSLEYNNIHLDQPARNYDGEACNLPTHRCGVVFIPKPKPPSYSIERLFAALKSYYTQLERREAYGTLIQLSAEHCAALSGINDIFGYGWDYVNYQSAAGHLTKLRQEGMRLVSESKRYQYYDILLDTPGESSTPHDGAKELESLERLPSGTGREGT